MPKSETAQSVISAIQASDREISMVVILYKDGTASIVSGEQLQSVPHTAGLEASTVYGWPGRR